MGDAVRDKKRGQIIKWRTVNYGVNPTVLVAGDPANCLSQESSGYRPKR